ncbi:MAG TPA: hypothetical protein VNG13_05755 [Mycobacteriales bacterium]|nr:hypothetical protein [Mycobacteriales bacterium]
MPVARKNPAFRSDYPQPRLPGNAPIRLQLYDLAGDLEVAHLAAVLATAKT